MTNYVFDREKDFRINVSIDYMIFSTKTMYDKNDMVNSHQIKCSINLARLSYQCSFEFFS